jgi:predicted DNA-binding WGR domain protein
MFQFTDDNSSKFWEITVVKTSITVRYGRIGTDGQTKTKAYTTSRDAAKASEKQIGEKVKKGYKEVKTATRSVAAKPTTPRKVSSKKAGRPVDAQQLATLESLLMQDSTDAVAQGIELLRSFDDPSLWSRMAKGLSIGDDGRITSKYSQLADLWILALTGRLKTARKLDCSGCKGLRDVRPLTGLSKLEVLNLSDCKDLVSLEGLSSLKALCELSLSGCTGLVDLDGLKGCDKLEAIELYGEIGVVVDLDERGLISRPGGWLPVMMDAAGNTDGYWGDEESDGALGSRKKEKATFAKLRDYLGLPRLLVVYIKEPGIERQDDAASEGWEWDSKARQWMRFRDYEYEE